MARSNRRATKYPYGGGRVVGNLAYDLAYEERRERRAEEERREARRRAEEERREAARREAQRQEAQSAKAQQPMPRRREQNAVRVRERQRVSGVMVLGIGALAMMVVAVLLSYAKLTSISASVVSKQQELKTLETEHVVLLTQYERTFDLETVKEAAAEAGMYKPSASQISYIDLSAPDSVEISETQSVSVLSRVFTSLGQSALSVVEYFS